MQLHEIIENAYQTFLDQLAGASIVLLHPHSRYRSMLVARMMNDPALNVYYYAMGPDDINLQAFLTSITHDMANQHPTFGRHINMLPQEVYQNPVRHFDMVIETFVIDLQEITDQQFILVLDEYDRSDTSDDVQRFVKVLSQVVPPNIKIVLNSRTLPRLPWVSMISENKAVMLKDDQIIYDDFYDNKKDAPPFMEIYALGPGFVLHNGEQIDTWEGHLPRLLFFFALDRPVITRSEICGAFWPDLDPDQAVNVFHVTKRRLHKALDCDVLVHDAGYYKINPTMPVYYDAMEYASALMQGRNGATPEERMAGWERASQLYRGPFLQGHSEDWIEERRVEFRAGYIEALTEMAAAMVHQERYDQALNLYKKASEEEIGREDLHREIMKLYAHLGRRSEVATHYQQLSEQMQNHNLNISDETATLYKEIMA